MKIAECMINTDNNISADRSANNKHSVQTEQDLFPNAEIKYPQAGF